ncbi:MAG TPA: division/cell wall cluster transcriptional repressor MraZ [Candidatus Acidoferrum sp.]|nr:division/cell wall cluster transcriptional repressor MraZ [Candidatus Acidoferrum sp.]
MLIGQSRHTMDVKGRVIIPQRFREDLGASFVITRGLDGCLFLYSMEEWDKLSSRIRSAPLGEARNMQRFFFANAEEAMPDAQGRIIIPANLRKLANLTKDVVIVGAESRAELWDAASWDGFEGTMGDKDVLAVMEKSGV